MLDVGWSLCSSNKTLHKNKCTTYTHRHRKTVLMENLCLNGLNHNNHPTFEQPYIANDLLLKNFLGSSFESFSLKNFHLNILIKTIAFREAITWKIQNWSAVDFFSFFIYMPLHWILKRQLRIFDRRKCVECRMANNKYEMSENMKFRAKQFEIGGSFWEIVNSEIEMKVICIRIGNACNRQSPVWKYI